MKVIPINEKVYIHALIVGYDLTTDMFYIDLDAGIINQPQLLIPGSGITKLMQHTYTVPKDFTYITHHYYKDKSGNIYHLLPSFHTNGNYLDASGNRGKGNKFTTVDNIVEYWRYVDTHVSLTLEFNYAEGEYYTVLCLEYNLEFKINKDLYHTLQQSR